MSDATRAFRAALSRDLIAFLEKMYPELNPGGELLLGRYLEYLSSVLGDVERGIDRRVIVNLPPRHLKSILISIVWPAWLLGRDPRRRIAVVSHSQPLAFDLAIKTRRLMETDAYRRIFPNTKLSEDRQKATDFETTEKGGRFAGSFDTGVTGRGFDLIIVDDPISAHDARSAAERANVNESFDGMIASRLDDQRHGAIIVVGQRLHEDDLSGHLLNKGTVWRHVCLPLAAEERAVYPTGSQLWTREVGEALLPEMWPQDVIDHTRASIGEANFATQYQQNPSALVGSLIKPDQIGLFDVLPPDARRFTLSFDTATKDGPNSSFTVGLVAATDGKRHFIVDVLRARLNPVEARDAAIRLILQHKPREVLIEDASSGPGLAHMLAEQYQRATLRSTGGLSKEERLEALLHLFAEQRVFVKRAQPWTQEFINEILRFPLGRHDDQVDALTQYLSWFVETMPPTRPIVMGASSADQRLANRLAGRARPLQKGEHAMRPRYTKFRGR